MKKINPYITTFAASWLVIPFIFLMLWIMILEPAENLDHITMVSLFFGAMFSPMFYGLMVEVPFKGYTPPKRLGWVYLIFAVLVFGTMFGFSSRWETIRRAPDLLEILGDCVVINENQALCHNNHWVCSRTSGECEGVGE